MTKTQLEKIRAYFRKRAVFIETGGSIPLWVWHATIYPLYLAVFYWIGAEIYYWFLFNSLLK